MRRRRRGVLVYLRWIFQTLDRKARADEVMARALERIATIMEDRERVRSHPLQYGNEGELRKQARAFKHPVPPEDGR